MRPVITDNRLVEKQHDNFVGIQFDARAGYQELVSSAQKKVKNAEK